MIHPDTELRFISPEIGLGVVATRLIPKGTITWVFDALDQTFTPAQIRTLQPLQKAFLEKYCYRDQLGDYVLCGDHARFVNHSFHSSCLSTAYNCELAIRDIQPGEELTDDYGYLNLEAPFDCQPEPGTSRTQALPDDLLRYHAQWDAQLREAFRYVAALPQPLLPLLEASLRAQLQAVANGQVEMESILTCYYAGPVVSPW